MKLSFWVRRTHKWIALIIGVQALLWMISGVYMTIVPIEIIHGDHLAHAKGEPLRRDGARINSAALLRAYPGATGLRLKTLLGKEVYELRQGPLVTLVDAASGAKLSPLAREPITQLANAAYAGEAPIERIDWVSEAPSELGARAMPVWAVRYAGLGKTTLYFSPYTGELVARRHELWRWFDFLWMLHIMDYESRSDVNNTLLRLASALGLVFSLSGLGLLAYSFKRKGRA